MVLREYPMVAEHADSLVLRLKEESFEKFYLPNHGNNFTGGPEDLARIRFNKYIGSCTHAVIHLKTNNLECEYSG